MATKLKAIKRISDLVPDDRNANRGTERGNAFIERSLREYGAGRSILIDRKGKIIAGNKTVENAAAIGLENLLVVQSDGRKIVVVQRTDLDMDRDPRARELALADNRSGDLNMEWNPEVLADLGREIDLSPFFSSDELAELIGKSERGTSTSTPEAKVDMAEELSGIWQTAKGQLWEIASVNAPRGVHRVFCGDSSSAADMGALWGSVTPRGVFTDPPYGVDYSTMRGGTSKIENDADPGEAMSVIVSALRPTAEFDAHFVCCNWRSMAMVHEAMDAAGIKAKACIVWDKKRGVQNLDRYFKQHEFVLYAGPYGGQPTACGDVWQFDRDFDVSHPTPKPPELVAKALSTAFAFGSTIYDPFMGSGSMLCGAENIGMIGYGMEIEPKYVAVALQRMADMGLTPKLAA